MSTAANHLLHERSPYLRLHAHNPVDWYPWGEEAFARARSEDKPIFLSIGYYTCHWCHVMERESFASPAIAALLNRDFVSIKVDREERPDVDRATMAFVQAVTGGGGWPLSAFLTPDLKPFFGGTYFPPQPRYGQPGFAGLLDAIATAWHTQRARLETSAAELTGALRQSIDAALGPPPAAPEGIATPAARDRIWQRTLDRLADGFDAVHGGFGGAPKFPRPAAIEFLLRFAACPHADPAARQRARAMLAATLRAMARGGVRDQLDGGFHRYATDAAWRVPHFEKMLYDQAQLLACYANAWQLDGDAEWAAVARGIGAYVLAELAAPGGGFFSAQDADSEIPPTRRPAGQEGPAHGEGACYTWSAAEFDAALGEVPAGAPPAWRELVRRYCGVAANGNVPAALDPHGEFTGLNILYCAAEPAVLFGPDHAAALEDARQRLLAARRRRPPPPTDDKVLSAWNGLMISGFARAGAALGQADWLRAARRAADFLAAHLYDAASNTLYRRFHGGERAVAGFADDYAFLIQGLLDLFEADSEPRWLDWARRLQRRQDELFWSGRGGYYGAGEDAALWLRLREDYDGAEPSPNSVAVFNLLRLSAWFDDAPLRERALATLAAFQSRLEASPEISPLLAAALEPATRPPGLVIVVGPEGFDDAAAGAAPAGSECARAQALLAAARRTFHPHHALLALAGGPRRQALARLAPRLAEVAATSPARAAALVCEGYVCRAPITDPGELLHALAAAR